MERTRPSGRWLWAALTIAYVLMSVDSVAQIVRAATPWGGLALLGASLLFAAFCAAGYRHYGRVIARAGHYAMSREAASAAEDAVVDALARGRVRADDTVPMETENE
ncbi:hypothetical protein D4765_13580 [Subtercola vilae]|uniref:Uncharacterized protein n=1 Tax=Subtercola vilae TaxID=2056433 RepID=A0A4T2BWF0_9MICO|nr:hypothetical protein D4765_13580 [Subtercola vilae]